MLLILLALVVLLIMPALLIVLILLPLPILLVVLILLALLILLVLLGLLVLLPAFGRIVPVLGLITGLDGIHDKGSFSVNTAACRGHLSQRRKSSRVDDHGSQLGRRRASDIGLARCRRTGSKSFFSQSANGKWEWAIIRKAERVFLGSITLRAIQSSGPGRDLPCRCGARLLKHAGLDLVSRKTRGLEAGQGRNCPPPALT
jgi:hypothetical protein